MDVQARTDAIEARVLKKASAAYEAAVSGVIRKHKETLRSVRDLEKREQYELAHARLKASGLVDDLAIAIARAGADAAQLITVALDDIREVMADEHDGETP